MTRRSHQRFTDGPARRLLAAGAAIYRIALHNPVSVGHLRIGALDPHARPIAALGLAIFCAFFVSLLFPEAWRAGDLVLIPGLSSQRGGVSVPTALMPVSMVALVFAWSLALWAAVRSSFAVAISVAVCFLLINAPLASESLTSI